MSGAEHKIYELKLEDEEATSNLAKLFSELVTQGDVILLDGDLGAGKSFFARSLIQALSKTQLGQKIEVPSPTFSLVQIYEELKPAIWHFDLYRTASADEAYDLGLEDAFKEAVCLIEWPSRLEGDYPANALLFFMQYVDENNRKLKIYAPTEWQSRLVNLLSKYESNL